ncbi:MAG: TonB-dependent receptor [Methylococcales bacterium]
MKHNNRLFILLLYLQASRSLANESIEDYFSKSLAELGSIPVSTLASGSPKFINQAASVTSVINAEQIKAMGATELHEVLETIPGMHAGIQGLSGDYRYSLRGIDNTNNSQLLFLLDGTRITTAFLGTLSTATELPLEGIDRIEVIRGPGSALYGADAFAGVVNIIPKKATSGQHASAGVRSGNWGSHSGWGNYTGHYAGWNIAANLQYQTTDGDSGRILKKDTQTAADSLFGSDASLAPGSLNTRYESINAHLNLQRKYWQINFWGFGADSGTRSGISFALDPNGKLSSENYLGEVRFSSEDWSQDWELTSHFSYLHTDYNADFQAFPKNTILPIGSDGNFNFRSVIKKFARFPDGANAIAGWATDTPSIEFGANYRGLAGHLLRFNAGYRHEQLTTDYHANYGAGVINATSLLPAPAVNTLTTQLHDLSNTPYVFLPNAQRSVWSGVLQDEWQINDSWQLTGGVRYDFYSDFGSTVNPRAALVWDISKQITSKWMYGRAFRAPSFSELGNQNSAARVGNKNLKPETIDSYEWGLDYHPNNSLRLSSNFFYYQLSDFIELFSNKDNSSAQYANGSKQSAYGAEFEWNWTLNEQWRFTGNYAWQQAKTDSNQHRMSGAPKHHIYSAAIWQFLPHWQLQSQLNWVADRGHDALDKRPLKNYQTVDFIIRGKKLFAQVNVSAALKNAFDSQYREQASLQAPENIPMPGRSFYFEASIDF